MLLAVGLMLLIAVVLSWIVPVAGPFVAGAVGGYHAGSVGRGLLAAIIPAIVLGILVLWMLPRVLEHVMGGIFFDPLIFPLVLVDEGALLLGAAAGGWYAHHRHKQAKAVRMEP